MTMIRDAGAPFAILARLPDGTSYILPALIFDLAGRLIEGRDELLLILGGGYGVEIPVLRNCVPGDLAEIDQRLAALRDRYGALPWPPAEP
jgi:hypothetical protein